MMTDEKMCARMACTVVRQRSVWAAAPELNVTAAHEIIFVIVIGRVEVHAVCFSDLADLLLAASEPDKARVELLDVVFHLRRTIPAWIHGN